MAELFDEIAQALARRTGSEETRVSEVIHAFFSGVEKELLRGEKQAIPGLGQFQLKEGRVHFNPAKILRDWLVENTIPDGPLPEHLLLNETQKSILQNLETSYPDLPAIDALNLEQGKQIQGENEMPAPASVQKVAPVVVAADLREKPSPPTEQSIIQTEPEKPREKKDVSPDPKKESIQPSSEKREILNQDRDHGPSPSKPEIDQVQKLKMILYATIGGFAVILILTAVFSIPWPKAQKIHFRDVKVPFSETGYYRVAVPVGTNGR